MTASFGSRAAEPDAPMQFLETESKDKTIQHPDREGLVLKNALSDLQSTQRKKTPGLEELRHSSMELLQHLLSVLVLSSSQPSFTNCTELPAAEARLLAASKLANIKPISIIYRLH